MGLMSKWTDGEREAPEPLEGNVVATITIGTAVWFLLFVAQLPFYGWFADGGHEWWIWTCAAGAGLGLAGVWYVRARDAALRRSASEPTTEASPDAPMATDATTAPDTAPGTDTDGTSRTAGAVRENGQRERREPAASEPGESVAE